MNAAPSPIQAPIRALHVFGVLSRTGGAEKWVLDMLRCKDRRLQIDFLLNVDDGPIVQEVRQLGSKVHLVPFSKSPVPWSGGNSYLAAVRKILRTERYEVIHTHQFDLSGELLRIAAEENIPVRVMSVHATEYENPRFYRRFVHRIWGHPWIYHYATSILPCSRAVADSFPAPNETDRTKIRILYTGIDIEAFRKALLKQPTLEKTDASPAGAAAGTVAGVMAAHSARLMQEFRIPEQALVIGHIGRFALQKNQAFLIDLLEEMMRRNDNLYAVLVGQGERLDAMRKHVRYKGLSDRIIMPGPRNDIPELLTSLFDVFVLPSLYEGLPIVAFEALACGLSVVMSNRISDELDAFFPDRIVQVPLEDGWTHWAEEIKKMMSVRLRPFVALSAWGKTPFTIRSSLEKMISIYEADLRKSQTLKREETVSK